jgi:hypothetical protein
LGEEKQQEGQGQGQEKEQEEHCQQKQDEKWQRVPPKDGEANKKKHNSRTYHWCKHHMTWGIHKEMDCHLYQEHVKQQNEGCNQVSAQAATATVSNSQWFNLIANMHRNMADE